MRDINKQQSVKRTEQGVGRSGEKEKIKENISEFASHSSPFPLSLFYLLNSCCRQIYDCQKVRERERLQSVETTMDGARQWDNGACNKRGMRQKAVKDLHKANCNYIRALNY